MPTLGFQNNRVSMDRSPLVWLRQAEPLRGPVRVVSPIRLGDSICDCRISVWWLPVALERCLSGLAAGSIRQSSAG